MHSDFATPDSPAPFAADLSLVESICSGSTSAWHGFINRYSGLIYTVIRRHLFAEDEDELRSVYVDILKGLYDGDLAKYRGEAPLATWLIVSTRSRTIDAARRRHGRIRTPTGHDKLSEFDKKVLQLFYIDRLPLEVVVHTLDWKGWSTNVDDIVGSIQRIERRLGQRYLRRLDEEHGARKFGPGSAETLKYLVRQRMDFEGRTAASRADQSLKEEQVLETARRLREAVSALSPEEQRLVRLRFERGLSAREIANSLELDGPRRAYTLIDKVIKKLRRAMRSGDD